MTKEDHLNCKTCGMWYSENSAPISILDDETLKPHYFCTCKEYGNSVQLEDAYETGECTPAMYARYKELELERYRLVKKIEEIDSEMRMIPCYG